jgi:hypothetical protein
MKTILACAIALGIPIVLPLAQRAGAQELAPPAIDRLLQEPSVPFKLDSVEFKDAVPMPRTARLQILGMQAGFFINPLGLDLDDDLPPGAAGEVAAARAGAADSDLVQLNIGAYNPYLDMRHPGDPGAIGYYKVHSQLQLLDAGSTSLCLNVQGYTPAGIQAGGVANGPSYVIPAVAAFQELGFGTAVHGYFGQNIQTNSRWTDRLNGGYQYGMAVQCAVPGTAVGTDQGLFLFLEALGRYRYDMPQPAQSAASRPALWEVVPGLQMRVNGDCWMNVAASRYNFLSCTWKY